MNKPSASAARIVVVDDHGMLLSVKTIERYKENLKQKLHIENATQLVQQATQWILQRGLLAIWS